MKREERPHAAAVRRTARARARRQAGDQDELNLQATSRRVGTQRRPSRAGRRRAPGCGGSTCCRVEQFGSRALRGSCRVNATHQMGAGRGDRLRRQRRPLHARDINEEEMLRGRPRGALAGRLRECPTAAAVSARGGVQARMKFSGAAPRRRRRRTRCGHTAPIRRRRRRRRRRRGGKLFASPGVAGGYVGDGGGGAGGSRQLLSRRGDGLRPRSVVAAAAARGAGAGAGRSGGLGGRRRRARGLDEAVSASACHSVA